LSDRWVELDTRDEVVDFVVYWGKLTAIGRTKLITRIGIHNARYYEWARRYGEENRHNGQIPRDYWITEAEKTSVIEYFQEHSQEGYRRLTYMMIDENVVAISPASVHRILSAAGLMGRRTRRSSSKGKGFTQPLKAHAHWHIDISYINICGTFYYMCTLLDGFSRAIVHWEIEPQMKESDVEVVIEVAKEKHPKARPRIISDNGPQFISKDFKEFIRVSGMTHVRTSPYYPQSNGKLERYHQTVKNECIRPGTPLDLEDAREKVAEFVTHYNRKRLHSALGYVTPFDKLSGRQETIFKDRELKLEQARKSRLRLAKAENHAPNGKMTQMQASQTCDPTHRAIHRQLRAMACRSYEFGIKDPPKGTMILRQWSDVQLDKSISWLKHMNAHGHDIYVRPAKLDGLVLLDDLQKTTIPTLKKEGLAPACILETSSENYQVWVRLSHSDDPMNEPKLLSYVARTLAEKYQGDVNSADWHHFGRLAGFTNTKPEYRDKQGRSPFVLIHEANGMIAKRGISTLKELKATHIKQDPIQSKPKLRVLSPNCPRKITSSLYAHTVKSITARNQDKAWVKKADASRLDYMVALDLLQQGYDPHQIQRALHIGSPQLSTRKAGHLDDYLTRTLTKAVLTFSPHLKGNSANQIDRPPG